MFISRHTIVCRVAQEAGASHYGYINKKKENVIFTSLYLGDTLSDWNLQSCLPARAVHISNLRKSPIAFSSYEQPKFWVFFFTFLHTCKNFYKTQKHTPITLKFGTQKGSPKVNPSIKCGTNPMNG